jgi:hypothetical protein
MNKWDGSVSVDYEHDVATPDGEFEEMCYWWEDMRPREVKKAILEAYLRGYARGLALPQSTDAPTNFTEKEIK